MKLILREEAYHPTPQTVSGDFIKDQSGWQEITMLFVPVTANLNQFIIGNFWLTQTKFDNSNSNCSDSGGASIFIDDVSIIPVEELEATNYNLDTIVCLYDSSLVLSNIKENNGNYEWTSDSTIFTSFENEGTYIISKTFNCSSIKDTLTIINKCNSAAVPIDTTVLPQTIVIPNILVTHGELNGKFIIKGLEDYPNSSLTIFNRWGKTVFYSKDYQNDWRGLNSSEHQLSRGTYYYVLIVPNKSPSNGFITIINQ